MSFLFNFSPLDDDEDCNEGTSTPDFISSRRSEEKKVADGSNVKNEVSPESIEVNEFYDENIIKKLSLKTMQFGSHQLRLVDTYHLEQMLLTDKEFQTMLKSTRTLSAISSQSDLVSGSYEGGLKIWECGVDLTEFLSSHPSSPEIKGKNILELGCGAGLPGLYCCQAGASSVHFQDYNDEVLRLLTHPNMVMCMGEKASGTQCRYFSGDWASFARLAMEENLRYDIILTAETIYNPENYRKLCQVFESTLKTDGAVLVAAKSYYFGVGGSIDGFSEYIGSCGCFTHDEVHSIKTGVPRKILLLRRKTNFDKEERDSEVS